MSFHLWETAMDHRVIVAHRGVCGGNIPCNTMVAYETALKQGADMIETDLSMSADGELVIFHPGMERVQLAFAGKIPETSYAEIKKLRYINGDSAPTQFGLVHFDELLETFKGRCYINVDKFWGNPEAIYRAVKRHNMIDQILVKSHLSESVLQVLEQVAPELPFMPIVRQSHPMHEALLRRNINYVGVEVLFEEDDNPMAGQKFIDQMHRDGKLVWVNAIIYDYKQQLSGGHSDDSALSVSMDYGWGWLADRYDVIQTDWVMMLIDYLKKSGRYYK